MAVVSVGNLFILAGVFGPLLFFIAKVESAYLFIQTGNFVLLALPLHLELVLLLALGFLVGADNLVHFFLMDQLLVQLFLNQVLLLAL